MDEEVTEEEEGKALADLRDGKVTPGLSKQLELTALFLQTVAMPPSAERIAKVKARMNVRRQVRWSTRIAAAASITASVLLVVWFITRPIATPEPSREVMQASLDAAKSGDPSGIDLAMRGYRMELVKTQPLAGAEQVHTRADAAIAAGDFGAAREALATLKGKGGVVERDAWFRLATVELRAAQSDAAVANASRGLELGKPADIFTVNLLLARAAANKARGDKDAAANDLHAAIVMLDEMSNRALEDR